MSAESKQSRKLSSCSTKKKAVDFSPTKTDFTGEPYNADENENNDSKGNEGEVSLNWLIPVPFFVQISVFDGPVVSHLHTIVFYGSVRRKK